MEGFEIGNLFAHIKVKVVWVFEIFGPSILPFSLSGGGDFFMMYILHEWFLSYITTIEEEDLMTCIISFLSMYLLFGEGFSRLLRHLHLTSKMKWGMGVQLDFD